MVPGGTRTAGGAVLTGMRAGQYRGLDVLLVIVTVVATLAGCAGGRAPVPPGAPVATQPPPVKGGGYYQDDGPGDRPSAELLATPDATPRAEPLHRFANRPYRVMGRTYVPHRSLKPYRARGVASWYGRKFHGKRTSSGERYDMYAMTAAHPVLPIPSYVRVTNLDTGKTVVVRVNDRGPFLRSRLIDLSYAAAFKLGVVQNGHARVQVEGVRQPGPRPEPAEEPKEDLAAADDDILLAALVNEEQADDERADDERTGAPPAGAAASKAGLAPGAGKRGESAPATRAEDTVPLRAGAGGVYLQLGAFRGRDNADAFSDTLKDALGAMAGDVHVYLQGGLHRVHAGPYADAGAARRAAERIQERLGFRPMTADR